MPIKDTEADIDPVPPLLQQFVIECDKELYTAERLSSKESSYW
jgi:hypothetical protein